MFQSAGIARTQRGHVSGLGPYAIHRLDIDKAQSSIILEDPRLGLSGAARPAGGRA